jgi:hypothetical protein
LIRLPGGHRTPSDRLIINVAKDPHRHSRKNTLPYELLPAPWVILLPLLRGHPPGHAPAVTASGSKKGFEIDPVFGIHRLETDQVGWLRQESLHSCVFPTLNIGNC